jgi:hypothetical protein
MPDELWQGRVRFGAVWLGWVWHGLARQGIYQQMRTEITGRQMIIYLRAINARAQLRPRSRLIEIWRRIRKLLTRNPWLEPRRKESIR